jgi:hypothetical protein
MWPASENGPEGLPGCLHCSNHSIRLQHKPTTRKRGAREAVSIVSRRPPTPRRGMPARSHRRVTVAPVTLGSPSVAGEALGPPLTPQQPQEILGESLVAVKGLAATHPAANVKSLPRYIASIRGVHAQSTPNPLIIIANILRSLDNFSIRGLVGGCENLDYRNIISYFNWLDSAELHTIANAASAARAVFGRTRQPVHPAWLYLANKRSLRL